MVVDWWNVFEEEVLILIRAVSGLPTIQK